MPTLSASLILILAALCIALFAPGAGGAEPPVSHLRPGEHILVVGDSITAGGEYVRMVQRAVTAVYPESGIVVVNHGASGQTASAAPGLVKAYLKAAKPTIVIVMFGVNDTRWSAADGEAKAKEFRQHLETMVGLREEHGFELIFARESHFSHGKQPDAWAEGLNGVLYRLFAEQDAVAVEHDVRVIDVHGAYTRELASAWDVDPLYEFTPDVVHPGAFGSAAMAGEILRALGVGLPLAVDARGPLRTARPNPLALTIAPAAGAVAMDEAVRVSVTATEALTGQLCCVAGTWAGRIVVAGERQFEVALPAAALPVSGAVEPLHLVLVGADKVFFGYAPFSCARGQDLTVGVNWGKEDLGKFPEGSADVAPVDAIMVRAAGTGVEVQFTWNDTTPVFNEGPYTDRFRREVADGLATFPRAGDRPCDSVELFFDLRPPAAAGRSTADVDSTPVGVLRVAIARDPAGNVVQALTPPEPQRTVTVSRQENRIRAVVTPMPDDFRFNLVVTDAAAFEAGKAAVYHLVSGHPQESGVFPRLSAKPDLCFRVGY